LKEIKEVHVRREAGEKGRAEHARTIARNLEKSLNKQRTEGSGSFNCCEKKIEWREIR
jgi:hypothetical protein